MTSRTASNLMALHAGVALGGGAALWHWPLFVCGIVAGLTNLAMFHANKLYEGE